MAKIGKTKKKGAGKLGLGPNFVNVGHVSGNSTFVSSPIGLMVFTLVMLTRVLALGGPWVSEYWSETHRRADIPGGTNSGEIAAREFRPAGARQKFFPPSLREDSQPAPPFEEGPHGMIASGLVRPYVEPWSYQVLPDGLIYRSYLAGARESRMGSSWVNRKNVGWVWDIALGARVGIARWGTKNPLRPEGWQIDIEGAGLPRLDLQHRRELVATDFRFGIPITYGRGRYQTKIAYYHLSSHLGDEFMVQNPSVARINYSRDVIVWGHSFYYTEDLRVYGEVGWASWADDGSEPWEFQFGADYSPARTNGLRGSPFFALNAHLREEVGFGGNLVVQTGWQWRGETGNLFRAGMQYFNGMSEQFQFFNQYENKLGMGVWYDF